MNPGETIYFGLIGIALLAALMFIGLIFKNRKRRVLVLPGMLAVGFIGCYLYFPVLKINEHEERYELLLGHLSKKYLEAEFSTIPKRYEPGYSVSSYVDKAGKVSQLSTWTKQEYPTQQELWRELEFSYGEEYSLDKTLPDINKQDEWMEGELTVFALDIDDAPAIVVYNYSQQGYGFSGIDRGDKDGAAFIESAGRVFLYLDENYAGETATIQLEGGEAYTFNAAKYRGQLIVEQLNE